MFLIIESLIGNSPALNICLVWLAMAPKQSAIQKSMKVIRVMKKMKGSTNGKGKGMSNGGVIRKKPASTLASKLTSMKAMKSKGPKQSMKTQTKPEYVHVSNYMIAEEKKRRLWFEWYDLKMHNKSYGEGCEK